MASAVLPLSPAEPPAYVPSNDPATWAQEWQAVMGPELASVALDGFASGGPGCVVCSDRPTWVDSADLRDIPAVPDLPELTALVSSYDPSVSYVIEYWTGPWFWQDLGAAL